MQLHGAYAKGTKMPCKDWDVCQMLVNGKDVARSQEEKAYCCV